MLTIICFHRRDERCCVVFGNAQKKSSRSPSGFPPQKKILVEDGAKKRRAVGFSGIVNRNDASVPVANESFVSQKAIPAASGFPTCIRTGPR
jgi:hypothetical protein